MENEDKKKEKSQPHNSRRVSLFKRRKKYDLRPLIREKKNKESKKHLKKLIYAVLLIFLVALFMYGIKTFVLSGFFYKNTTIINPAGVRVPDLYQIKSILSKRGISNNNILFATDSASVSFFIDKTQVFLNRNKDINSQLDMVEAIGKQMVEDGKQAFSIDLRYNKPIVKF